MLSDSSKVHHRKYIPPITSFEVLHYGNITFVFSFTSNICCVPKDKAGLQVKY